MNGDKISSLVIMWWWGGDFSSLCRSNFRDVDFREILSGVVHFPLLSKIINYQSIESHLSTIQYDSFCLFLCSYEFINANDSAKIPNIAEDNNIIFETIFLRNFCIDFIDINFIIKFVTHLNKMISTWFFIDELSRVIYCVK